MGHPPVIAHAIIAGDGRSIGMAVAERMLANFASVAIWDRDRQLPNFLAGKFEANGKVLILRADIVSLANVESAAVATKSRFGKIDIRITNAAIIGSNATTWTHQPRDFINVVKVGSIGIFLDEGYSVHLVNLGKQLASYDIAINAVTPAIVRTTMALSPTPNLQQMILCKILCGRMLELMEAACLICLLATNENSFTTAATFDLSGGRSMYRKRRLWSALGELLRLERVDESDDSFIGLLEMLQHHLLAERKHPVTTAGVILSGEAGATSSTSVPR